MLGKKKIGKNTEEKKKLDKCTAWESRTAMPELLRSPPATMGMLLVMLSRVPSLMPCFSVGT